MQPEGYTSVSSFPGNRRVPAPDLQLVGCQNLVPAARKASRAIEGRYQTNFTEAEALNTQRQFGGEIVKVYTHD